jgi:heme/copper-type cytochrome/quinol oxidase subunit 2
MGPGPDEPLAPRWRLTFHMTRFAFRAGLVVSAVLVLAGLHVSAQDDNHREITIAAKDGAYQPAKVEVRQNDLVKVTFAAEDGPHSLNIDAYRIAKRARPGRPAVFEFRADRAGTFPYYCNLSDPGSHDMKGELIVRER